LGSSPALARRGRGPPAIYDPPRELVVAGLYRYVRNPQYVGVVLVILGEALLTGMAVLFGYATLMAVVYHLFVRYYEEPTLGRLFGESYARYREAVPRWLPRRPGRTLLGIRPRQQAILVVRGCRHPRRGFTLSYMSRTSCSSSSRYSVP